MVLQYIVLVCFKTVTTSAILGFFGPVQLLPFKGRTANTVTWKDDVTLYVMHLVLLLILKG